jgi:N-acetylmuramoyl-L-alanine amidase
MIAYLPASGDRNETVFLDAGHGGALAQAIDQYLTSA